MKKAITIMAVAIGLTASIETNFRTLIAGANPKPTNIPTHTDSFKTVLS